MLKSDEGLKKAVVQESRRMVREREKGGRRWEETQKIKQMEQSVNIGNLEHREYEHFNNTLASFYKF